MPFFALTWIYIFPILAPLSYKKDTIYAIEEEYADNSDVDIESGKVSKKKFKKLRSKKRQDYRNKLEDWPNCNVRFLWFFLNF